LIRDAAAPVLSPLTGGMEPAACRTAALQQAGATLAELLVVMAVIAVLSGTAIALLSGGRAQSAAGAAAAQLAEDIAYAQADAIARHLPRTLIFDTEHESYALYENGTALRHPVTGKFFVVDLDAAYPGTGIDLAKVGIGAGDSLRFTADGTPHAGGALLLHAAGEGALLSIAAETGWVSQTSLSGSLDEMAAELTGGKEPEEPGGGAPGGGVDPGEGKDPGGTPPGGKSLKGF